MPSFTTCNREVFYMQMLQIIWIVQNILMKTKSQNPSIKLWKIINEIRIYNNSWTQIFLL